MASSSDTPRNGPVLERPVIKYDPTKRNGDLSEFVTPPELARVVVETIVPESLLYTGEIVRVLDPGANSGVWGRAVRNRWPFVVMTGLEIMDMPQPAGYDVWFAGHDYLLDSLPPFKREYDLIIGNPPYTTVRHGPRTAEFFVERSMSLLRPGGYLIFLLVLGFLSSQNRGEGLHQRHPLTELHISTRRPSFYKYDTRESDHFGTGHTNAYDYGVFVWRKGHKGPFSGSWFSWNYEDGKAAT